MYLLVLCNWTLSLSFTKPIISSKSPVVNLINSEIKSAFVTTFATIMRTLIKQSSFMNLQKLRLNKCTLHYTKIYEILSCLATVYSRAEKLQITNFDVMVLKILEFYLNELLVYVMKIMNQEEQITLIGVTQINFILFLLAPFPQRGKVFPLSIFLVTTPIFWTVRTATLLKRFT